VRADWRSAAGQTGRVAFGIAIGTDPAVLLAAATMGIATASALLPRLTR
jgi:UbiD family decarboxylase